MQTLTLTETQQRLAELVRGLARNGEIVITDADRPVAKLSPIGERKSLREIAPQSVGAFLRPFPDPEGDYLGEMIGSHS